MANTLYLRLEAPLQSWGERGRWSIRDSAPEPTKSGVIGLLGCAMGLSDDESLRALSAAFRMGVRVDRAGQRLVDYHTIGGGYDQPMLLTAAGKPKISSGAPHTEISERAYLCDASFLVALIGPPEGIEEAAAALQAPVWPYFLGRKSCPPARPVFVKTATVEELTPSDRMLIAALERGPWEPRPDRATAQATPGRVPVIVECEARPGAVRRRDELVARHFRLFGPRYTRTASVAVPPREEPPA